MQNILFSIYCGLTVSICYKLSRGSSNPNVLWNVIKSDVLQMKKTPADHDDIQDPLPDKLKTILVSRSLKQHRYTLHSNNTCSFRNNDYSQIFSSVSSYLSLPLPLMLPPPLRVFK